MSVRAPAVPPPTRRPWRSALVLGGIQVLLGVYATSFGLLTLTWPHVDAVIDWASLDERENQETVPGTDKYRGGRTETRVSAKFQVRYRYQVGGTDYEGSGVEPADLGLQTSAAAREMASLYRPGMHVTAAYDPGDPADAYLRPGPSSVALKLLAIGGVFMLIGLWRRRR